jgi:hypothetical protein
VLSPQQTLEARDKSLGQRAAPLANDEGVMMARALCLNCPSHAARKQRAPVGNKVSHRQTVQSPEEVGHVSRDESHSVGVD